MSDPVESAIDSHLSIQEREYDVSMRIEQVVKQTCSELQITTDQFEYYWNLIKGFRAHQQQDSSMESQDAGK